MMSSFFCLAKLMVKAFKKISSRFLLYLVVKKKTVLVFLSERSSSLEEHRFRRGGSLVLHTFGDL